ncbi:MAG: ethanolamine utilization protein EutJ [Gemmatales bacterium]|nr:MAG: ethanolamine utilization protein EutJ [Gemmatales bacterium]
MKSTRRRWIHLVLLFWLPATGCFGKKEPEPIWLGHIAPLSGPERGRGTSSRQGILLAVEELNASEEKINGRRAIVIHADARSDARSARAVLVRLITINQVRAVFGGKETARIEGLSGLAATNKVPIVVAAARPENAASSYVFYTGLVPQRRGQALAVFADQELKTKHMAIALDERESPSVIEAFLRHMPPGKIIGRWSFKESEQLKEIVGEMRNQKADAVLFNGNEGDVSRLAKLLQGTGIPILVASTDERMDEWTAAPLPVPLYVSTAFVPNLDMPAAKEFSKRYQERFGEPPDVFAALAYDDARLLFEAFRKADTPDGQKVRDALNDVSLDGVTGKLAFAKNQLARPLFVVKIENRTTEVMKSFQP